MPYSPSQTGLFMAAAHDPEIARRKGLTTGKARELAMESSPATRSRAARQMARAKALRKRRDG